MFGNHWYKKEKPLATLIGMGGGATSPHMGGGLAPQIEASGGSLHDQIESDGNLWRYHFFSHPGTFTISDVGASDGSVQYIVVGGGGGTGRGKYAGGAGAGGMRTNFPDVSSAIAAAPSITLAASSSAVEVGRGGVNLSDPARNSAKGNTSSIAFPTGTVTCPGGGGGAGRTTPRGSGPNQSGNPFEGRIGDPGACGGGGSYAAGPTELNVPASNGSFGGNGGQLGPGEEKRFGTGGGGMGAPTAKHGGQSIFPAAPAPGGPWPNGDSGPFPPGAAPFPFAGGVGGLGARVASISTTVFGTPGPSPGRWFAGGGGGGTGMGGAGHPMSTSPLTGNSREGGAGGGGRGGGGGFQSWNQRMIDLKQPDVGVTNPAWTGPPTSPFPGTNPTAGTPNALQTHAGAGNGDSYTGGGGGGNGDPGGSSGPGTMGGPGVCIVRYIISPAQSGTAKATGGMVSFYNNKTIHTFHTPGTFVTPGSFNETCEYVIVGGGGAGGDGGAPQRAGGGGGAGGFRTGTTPVGGPLSLTVKIGLGGVGSFGPSRWWYTPGATDNYYGWSQAGTPGGPSYVNFPGGTIQSEGGGCGGHHSGEVPSNNQPPYMNIGPQNPTYPGAPGAGPPWYDGSGEPGGSGGGGACAEGGSATSKGNRQIMRYTTPVPPQGYDGGTTPENTGGAAGGGGAGGAGGSVSGNAPQSAGNGGVGKIIPTTFRNPLASYGPGPSSSVWYLAGGGCGGHVSPTASPMGNPGSAAPIQRSVGGGGGEQQHTSEGAGNAPGQTYIKGPESGYMGTGSGGGGGCVVNPNDRYTPGGCGGDGIILIAYPS